MSSKKIDDFINDYKLENELEDTKELDTLKNLKVEKQENSTDLKYQLKDLVNFDDEDLIENKKPKVGLIICIIVICLILILTVIFTLMFFKNNKPIKEDKVVIDYEKVINEYGNKSEEIINKYIKENKEIPTWTQISDLINYDKYKVLCKIHNIYEDGNVYLNECKVNNKLVDYYYGVLQEEKGMKLDIYKLDDKYYYSTNKNNDIGSLVGNITCKTDDCKFVDAYEKFVIINEKDKYYVYNYEDDSMEYGPFIDIENSILSYENNLYGVISLVNNELNIYNINIGKKLKNIKGNILLSSENLNTELMYKYGYVIFNNNNINEFVNLKTGNVSYSIDGEIIYLIENAKENLVYIIVNNKLDSKNILYNSNGKKLFDGKEFNDIRVLESSIILSDDTKYYIYDTDLKLKNTSKTYDNILGLYEDFIVTVDNEYLEIVDLEDNILATYDLKWDDNMYTFDKILSGKDNNMIYLIIERSNSSLKYYYNLETKEFGLK